MREKNIITCEKNTMLEILSWFNINIDNNGFITDGLTGDYIINDSDDKIHISTIIGISKDETTHKLKILQNVLPTLIELSDEIK